MQIETFTGMLLILVGLGVTGNIVWRLAMRYPVNEENLLAVLWKDYKGGLHWLLRRRWILNLLILGAAVRPLIRCLVFLREDTWVQSHGFGLLPAWEWAKYLSAGFVQRWIFTYFLSPLGAIRPLVEPFRYGTAPATTLALVAGLWLFRLYTAKVEAPEELYQEIEWFRKTINVTTLLAGSVLAGSILCVAFGLPVHTFVLPSPAYGAPYWICLSLSVLVLAIYTALFTSAMLGSFSMHLNGASFERPSLEAFRFCRPLFTLAICLALIITLQTRVIPYSISRIRTFHPQIARWYMLHIVHVLMDLVYLAVLFVPAAIVADRVPLRTAIRRNLAVWRTHPIQMVVVVAFFMAVAFAIHSAFTLVTSPISPSWIIIDVLRSFIFLLMRTSITLGVYRFYRRISERNTGSKSLTGELWDQTDPDVLPSGG